MKFEAKPEIPAWWIGTKGKCVDCGGKIELEAGDPLILSGPDLYTFTCPGCGEEIEVSKNWINGKGVMQNALRAIAVEAVS